MQTGFSQKLCCFTFSPTIYKHSNFNISLPRLIIFHFFLPCIIMILINMMLHFIVVVICIPPMINDVENLFRFYSLFCICVSSLQKCLVGLLIIILMGGVFFFVFLLLSYKCSLQISHQMYYLQLFSPISQVVLHFLIPFDALCF